MEDKSRIFYTVKNLVYTWSGYFAVVVCTFAGRTFFVKTIGTDYLGIGGLFASMLSCLNLADLGLGAAVTYSLYKPLAEHDGEKIAAILSFLHRAYTIIGIVVGAAGLLLVPFLESFMHGIPDKIRYADIQLYYILFVLDNALEYLLSYKAVLLKADQKQYIVEVNYSAGTAVMTMIQIVILTVTRNYLFYLLVQIVFTILRNVIISVIVDREYPYLKTLAPDGMSKQDKNSLAKGIGGRVFQKAGTVAVNSTDNIIISKYIAVFTVGLYGNYSSIISASGMLLGQVFQSALASVGNLNVTAEKSKMADVFFKSLFINFWLYGLTGISMICLLNPLVEVWLGKEFMLAQEIVIILGINFYLNGMRQTSLMFGDALGLYWENRYKPVFEALVNLVMSLLLVRFLGLAGVFLGTTCSIVIVCLWSEPYIIFKYALLMPAGYYFRNYLKYLLAAAGMGFFTYFICSSILCGSVAGLMIKTAVCMTVPNAGFFILFRKSQAFLFYFDFLKKLIRRKI